MFVGKLASWVNRSVGAFQNWEGVEIKVRQKIIKLKQMNELLTLKSQ